MEKSEDKKDVILCKHCHKEIFENIYGWFHVYDHGKLCHIGRTNEPIPFIAEPD